MVDQTIGDGLRVLHVTEASGGGVLQVVARLAQHQSAAGAHVTVALTERYDTPSTADLHSRFANCRIIKLGGGKTLKRLWQIFLLVRRSRLANDFDIIHLHSSYAGLAGRLAALATFKSRVSVVYSAHAYGFLRTDLPRYIRPLIFAAESVLSQFSSGTIAISDSEAAFAGKLGAKSKVRVLANVLPLPPVAVPRPGRLVVANIGRLVPQKGPGRFACAAQRLSGSADFVWIGGPTSEAEPVALGREVNVTGLLSHEAALETLSKASIHLFTSEWEGMPLALMESQAMGIPAIAWDCPGISDVVLDGRTGFIVRSEAEMLARLKELLGNAELRTEMSAETRALRTRFSDDGYGARSIKIYSEFVRAAHLRGLPRKQSRISG